MHLLLKMKILGKNKIKMLKKRIFAEFLSFKIFY